MKLPTSCGAAATAFLLTILPVYADVLFEEDFNQVPNLQGLTQWQGDKEAVTEADGAWMEIREDAGNAFGEGAANKFLAIQDRSEIEQVSTLAALNGAQDVVTASFDFIEPEGSASGPFIFRIGVGKNTDGERAANVDLRDGRTANGMKDAYKIGSKHHMTVVVNNSPDTVSYGGDSLPSQHYDLYLDDKLLQAGIPFDTKDNTLSAGAPIDALRVLTYTDGTRDQTVFIDNIKVENGARRP
jgi:hypothetical protein